MTKEKAVQEIDIMSFTSVLLAAILLGFITHELVHLFLVSNVSSITLHFGRPLASVSVCCLSPGESAFEELAYIIQAITTFIWVVLNRKVYLRDMN